MERSELIKALEAAKAAQRPAPKARLQPGQQSSREKVYRGRLLAIEERTPMEFLLRAKAVQFHTPEQIAQIAAIVDTLRGRVFQYPSEEWLAKESAEGVCVDASHMEWLGAEFSSCGFTQSETGKLLLPQAFSVFDHIEFHGFSGLEMETSAVDKKLIQSFIASAILVAWDPTFLDYYYLNKPEDIGVPYEGRDFVLYPPQYFFDYAKMASSPQHDFLPPHNLPDVNPLHVALEQYLPPCQELMRNIRARAANLVISYGSDSEQKESIVFMIEILGARGTEQIFFNFRLCHLAHWPYFKQHVAALKADPIPALPLRMQYD